MSLFNPEDFGESIDDMCDDAVRRLYAFREGGLSTMHARDHYFSRILEREPRFRLISFQTELRAEIVDDIHEDVLSAELPDYALDILGGAVVALARHAAYHSRGSSGVMPNIETARSHVSGVMMMNEQNLKEKKPVKLFSQELGSLGLTTLVLNHDTAQWSLDYEAVRIVNLLKGK